MISWGFPKGLIWLLNGQIRRPNSRMCGHGIFKGSYRADSVEKVAPLFDLRQNCFIGRRGITEHDGTVIEWAGATVLLV
ncbi:hypothetical protein, partial [Pseudomonas typographi]|uniref:hypothetical protein n=1 Tax=Pseudomonas typographi TaxID=2715964 RepID=UPI001EEF2164